jgi:hypothetical protein
MRVSQIDRQYLTQQNCVRRSWLYSLVRMYHRMDEECDCFWKKGLAFPYGSPERLENMAVGDELSGWVSNLGNTEV